jgi:glycerol kinase
MYARGSVAGLTRGSTKEHIARAVLESIAYQVADLVHLMKESAGITLHELRVDGGASVSDVLLQFQADLLRIPVVRPHMVETTAMGAVYLAGLASGVWRDLDEIAALGEREEVFLPELEEAQSRAYYAGWQKAVARARNWEEPGQI